MYMISGRVLRGRTVVDAAQVRRLLCAAARPEDGLEHVYATTDLDSADAVLFLRASSPAGAKVAATRIMDRFLAQNELYGWEWAHPAPHP
jgi:hypothetical protein